MQKNFFPEFHSPNLKVCVAHKSKMHLYINLKVQFLNVMLKGKIFANGHWYHFEFLE